MTDQNLWRENEVLLGTYGFCLYYEDSQIKPLIKDIEVKRNQTITINTQ